MSFEAVIQQEGDDHKILLKDITSNCLVEIFAFGAVLNQFCVQLNNEELNVVDGFKDIADAKASMTPAFKSAKLSPFACRIKNEKYHFGDRSYHLRKYSMGKNAIHGLVYDAIFSIVETSAGDDEACVKLQHVYDNGAEGYPFCYRCEVEYKLQKNNQLSLTTTITNLDETLMPLADGWHPYFNLGDPVNMCQLEFQSKEMLEFDEELIPTGNVIAYEEFGSLKDFGTTSFDNCFTLNFAECQPMCVFRNPMKKVQLEIYPSQEYPYLQIYTPDDRRSIAIENLSAAPDALNNGMGLKVLEPHEQATFNTKFVVRQL